MIQENFLSLTYQSDEDRDPMVYTHESTDVAETHAREVLPNLPDGAYIVIARVECTMMKEIRIIKAPITKPIPAVVPITKSISAVAGHAS